MTDKSKERKAKNLLILMLLSREMLCTVKKNKKIARAVNFITGRELLAIGDEERLTRLSRELIGKDWFMTFPDFDSYVTARESAYTDYENRMEWAEKMLVNIAKAGYFSSDRTIAQYNKDIWKL